MAKIQQADVTDFVPDRNNANRGTEHGKKMIVDSLTEDGAGRSVVVDKNDNIVAGNKTMEAAALVGINKAVVVEVKGDELVVTKRMDWDLYQDEAARRYAYRDNRSGEESLDWDPGQVLADIDAGFDLSAIFTDDVLAEMEESVALSDDLTGMLDKGGMTGFDSTKRAKIIRPVLYTDDISDFELAIRETGIKERGQAIMEICRYYLEQKTG